jgi:acetolactate synthase-1/2/3 large subunit
MESPRGANDPSLGRFRHVWAEADLVIALGKPVDFSTGFGRPDVWPKARWITLHGDAAECARARRALGDRLITAFEANPALCARALASAPVIDRPDWVARVLQMTTAPLPPVETGLNSATLCQAVAHLVTNDTILICDGGEFGQWAQTIRGGSARIVNGVSGAIGAGLCYAMAARAARPDAPVLALMGDGTAGFHLPEFETAVREDLPFVAVIGNDRRWNAEHQIQLRDYGAARTHSCGLSGMRYDLAVQAMGGFGAHVTRLEDLQAALKTALHSGLPACVNVDIEGLPAPVF